MIVGLDMGGTHIDGVIIKNGSIIDTIKKPTNKDNLLESIWTTLQELLSGYDESKIARVNLSTTISTNAIVENKTSSVGMVIQSGPGLNHNYLACGDENIFISGYIDHRGKVIKDFNPTEIGCAVDQFKKNNIESYAVVTKFSTRNPSHELNIREILKEEDPLYITMGHTISGKLNFPRRVFTSYLNSAIHSTFEKFSTSIKKSLEKRGIDAPLSILKADGGTMDISMAENKPVETILSGPAASFMGISAMCDIHEDAVLLDIGGTTTDIFFLADGVPLFEPLGIQIGKYKTLVRAIYSNSIGLGGDSSIDIIDGKIKIGPKRQGYPYAFGGPKPTATDAMIVLGMIEEGNKERAYSAMNVLGRKLNLTPRAVSYLILETMVDIILNRVNKLIHKINSQPVYTIKDFLYGKKIKPKLINIIGGPARALSPIIEKKFNLPCYYPKNYHIANAIGAALAKPTMEISMLVDTSRKFLSVPELGIYKRIGRDYSAELARNEAMTLLKEYVASSDGDRDYTEVEITEENIFNMIKGFTTKGKNMRIKAQIKPGLTHRLRGDKYVESK